MTSSIPLSHYDAHLIFDNSPTPERYFYSSGWATAPSRLELLQGKLPVSENAVSPPNSLKLSWCSGRRGDWEAVIEVEPRRVRAETLQGDTLSFWCFTAAPIEAAALPLLALGLHGGQTLAFRLGQFTSDLTGGHWQQLKIPLSAFGGSTGEQNLLRLARLVFSQSIDDGEHHTFLLDKIRLLESHLTGERAAPTDLSAAGYPHHIDLAWKHEPDERTAYVLVQRARPGEDFVSIGTQRPEVDRFSDYLGQPGVRARYRVCAVGYDYLESAFSAIAEAETRPLSDDELLDMVQRALIRPYAERAHPEAGLALECLPGDDNLVALGASGFGLMALIVAAERGFLTREAVRTQTLRAVRFLAGAERFHGVWPHFLDGRTGETIPLFGKFDNGGDLVETAFMVQALLTVRQYFTEDHAAEREIRETSTRLWEEVEWDWYRKTPEGDVLYWHWSPDYGWHINHPLTGWNEAMIDYLLAIASPTHPVPPSLYETGWASQEAWAQAYRENWGKALAGSHYGSGESYEGLALPVGVGSGGRSFLAITRSWASTQEG